MTSTFVERWPMTTFVVWRSRGAVRAWSRGANGLSAFFFQSVCKEKTFRREKMDDDSFLFTTGIKGRKKTLAARSITPNGALGLWPLADIVLRRAGGSGLPAGFVVHFGSPTCLNWGPLRPRSA